MHLDFNDPLDVSFIRKQVNTSCVVESETPENDNTQSVAGSLDAILCCFSINETFASIQGDPFACDSNSHTDCTSSSTNYDEETDFSTRQVLSSYPSMVICSIHSKMSKANCGNCQ